VEVNDPTRDEALRRVCSPATSSSDPPCIFALKLTGYYSSTGFGLLLVEAAAVIATFFHSFEVFLQALFVQIHRSFDLFIRRRQRQNKTVILTKQ
jgi:hypothetical protein